jgi:hypothetical protein
MSPFRFDPPPPPSLAVDGLDRRDPVARVFRVGASE